MFCTTHVFHKDLYTLVVCVGLGAAMRFKMLYRQVGFDVFLCSTCVGNMYYICQLYCPCYCPLLG